MMRAFLRSLKINARRGERKLIVFMPGISGAYAGEQKLWIQQANAVLVLV